MVALGCCAILVASGLGLSTPPSSPAPDKVSVRFIVRVCEGSKFELVSGDELEAREKECPKPLEAVPLALVSGPTKTVWVETDGTGLAKVGPIEIGRGDGLRLVMACTTHNCMTLQLKGVASGDVREGDNRLLVFTVPNSSAEAGQHGAPN